MKNDETAELIISAARIVCPENQIDGKGTLLIRDGRIAALESGTADFERTSSRQLTFPDGILLPGLIDLHAHPARSGSVFGVDPDTTMLSRGATTVLSQGDAGADNIREFLHSTVRTSKTRILLALNLSRIGESANAGCFENLADADVDACVNAAAEYSHLVRMIAVNVSHHACGNTDPREILRRGLRAAEQAGLPLLYGMRRPGDWPLADQLKLLRAGDVVTYCFRREPHCIVDSGHVLPCIREARNRGILFDVGHGMTSFSFEVAEAAIGDGFVPDSVSTDLQKSHTGQIPPHDLPLVMSKLAAAGMTEADLFRAVTITPGKLLNLKAGSLTEGSPADLVLLKQENNVTLVDAIGIRRTGKRFVAGYVLRAGETVVP